MDEIIIFTRSKHRILGEIVGIDSFQRDNRLAKYLVNKRTPRFIYSGFFLADHKHTFPNFINLKMLPLTLLPLRLSIYPRSITRWI